MNSEAKVQMTDGWGCSMLMNAAILNLTKIRKQYVTYIVSNMHARRAQEHMNFLVFRKKLIFNFQSILVRRSSGFEVGLAKSGDELADLRVEQTALCKRLTTSGKCSNSSATTITSMPRALGSRLQMPKLSLVCILTTTYLH